MAIHRYNCHIFLFNFILLDSSRVCNFCALRIGSDTRSCQVTVMFVIVLMCFYIISVYIRIFEMNET